MAATAAERRLTRKIVAEFLSPLDFFLYLAAERPKRFERLSKSTLFGRGAAEDILAIFLSPFIFGRPSGIIPLMVLGFRLGRSTPAQPDQDPPDGFSFLGTGR